MPKLFEQTFFDYLNNIVRYMKAQPLHLGGYSYSGGGSGGPPGGFTGYLPQTRVAYDVSEIASSGMPSPTTLSGASLVDNLNHIRYRLGVLEGGFFGITVEEDSVIVGSGITVVDFRDVFDVVQTAPNTVTVTLDFETADKYVPSGIYGENLGPQIGPSGGSHFYVGNQIFDESLRVYLNGVRQHKTYHTYDTNKRGFTAAYTVVSGDTLSVDYDILINDTARIISSGVTVAYLEEFYYDKVDVNGIADAKADLSHTHTESQITDLSHDADLIKGIPVSTSGPLFGQALVYDGANYTPMSVSTSIKQINQQFLFTVEGVMADAGTGIKPIGIYSHDTNGIATIDEIFCYINTPPTSTDVRINILKNGVTIFDAPSYVTIPTGSSTGNRYYGFSDDEFTYNDRFQMEIVQTDPVGSDLTVHVRFHWETN